MKTILAAIIFGATLTTQAAMPSFDAFIDKNLLYVVVSVDSCNSHQVGISVEGSCNKNRLTANYADVCEADLMISSTRMACADRNSKVLMKVIDLAETDLAPEAKTLILSYGDEKMTLEINK